MEQTLIRKHQYQKEELEATIARLDDLSDSQDLNTEESTILNEAKKDLDFLDRYQTFHWKQKSRLRDFKEEDCNTRYFHKLVKGRRRLNRILRLHLNGRVVVDQTHLVRRIFICKRDMMRKPSFIIVL